jgi:hypothetical protein
MAIDLKKKQNNPFAKADIVGTTPTQNLAVPNAIATENISTGNNKENPADSIVQNIAANPDQTTTLTYKSGKKETLSREDENARNVAIAADAGMGGAIKQLPGAKITPRIKAMIDREKAANAELQSLEAERGVPGAEALMDVNRSKNPLDQQTGGIWGMAVDKITDNQFVKGTMKGIAEITTTAGSLVGFNIGKKSAGVTQAEERFGDTSAAIGARLDLYQQGLVSREAIVDDFNAASKTILQLERQTKGVGKVNLRYWLDEGAAIEEQIIREKAQLDALRAEFININLATPGL